MSFESGWPPTAHDEAAALRLVREQPARRRCRRAAEREHRPARRVDVVADLPVRAPRGAQPVEQRVGVAPSDCSASATSATSVVDAQRRLLRLQVGERPRRVVAPPRAGRAPPTTSAARRPVPPGSANAPPRRVRLHELSRRDRERRRGERARARPTRPPSAGASP